jgi:hypothetical protein
MKEFGSQIFAAVASGKHGQPFNDAMIKKASPVWANRTYYTFPGKHRVGYGKETELFVRVSRGWYRLNPKMVGSAKV